MTDTHETPTYPERGQYLVPSAGPLPERPSVAPKTPPPASGAIPRHWTYSVGNYTSFLYWHSFEEACNAAFENSPDVTEAHVFTPNGPGLDVTREQWAATTEEQWAEVRKP